MTSRIKMYFYSNRWKHFISKHNFSLDATANYQLVIDSILFLPTPDKVFDPSDVDL